MNLWLRCTGQFIQFEFSQHTCYETGTANVLKALNLQIVQQLMYTVRLYILFINSHTAPTTAFLIERGAYTVSTGCQRGEPVALLVGSRSHGPLIMRRTKTLEWYGCTCDWPKRHWSRHSKSIHSARGYFRPNVVFCCHFLNVFWTLQHLYVTVNIPHFVSTGEYTLVNKQMDLCDHFIAPGRTIPMFL